MMTRSGTALQIAGDRGSVLVEVLAAMVLLTVLIVPLATGMTSAANGAGRVRDQAGGLADGTAESATVAGWDWGLSVSSLQWESGPAARIKVDKPGGAETIVGLWLDGWFRGESTPGVDGVLEVPVTIWSGLAGCEVTVRVREPESDWGPPWRSMVPAEDYEPDPTRVAGQDPVAGDGAMTGTETVVHVPGLANPIVQVSDTGFVFEVDPLGLLFYLLPPSAGVCCVGLVDVAQSWRTEEGRALDLYF